MVDKRKKMTCRAIFLNTDFLFGNERGKITAVDQVAVSQPVRESLNRLSSLNFKVILLTTRSTLSVMHQRLSQLMKMENINCEKILDWPDVSVEKNDNARKDIILKSASELGIDLENSWLVGLNDFEIKAATLAKCRTILVEPSVSHARIKYTNAVSDFTVTTFKEAANIIKSRNLKKNIIINQPQSHIVENKAHVREDLEQEKTKDIQMPEQQETKDSFKPEISKTQTEHDHWHPSHYLKEIHQLLKSQHRENMFSEFSGITLAGWILQIIAGFLTIASVWSLIRNDKNSVFIYLQFGILIQLMTLTFFIIHKNKK